VEAKEEEVNFGLPVREALEYEGRVYPQMNNEYIEALNESRAADKGKDGGKTKPVKSYHIDRANPLRFGEEYESVARAAAEAGENYFHPQNENGEELEFFDYYQIIDTTGLSPEELNEAALPKKNRKLKRRID
jgi:hypothetical protein